jgi:hypothetical protein
MDKSVVEVKIRKDQSIRVILEGMEGFPVESPYEDVVILVTEKARNEAMNKKMMHQQGQACQTVDKAMSEDRYNAASGVIGGSAAMNRNRY